MRVLLCHLFIYIHGSTVTSMTYRKPAQQNKKIILGPQFCLCLSPSDQSPGRTGVDVDRQDLHVTKVMPTGERKPFVYVNYVELGNLPEGLNCIGGGGEVADG